MLDFRDWLRSCREDRERYACAKRRLAGRLGPMCSTTPTRSPQVVAEIFRHIRDGGWDERKPHLNGTRRSF